MQRTSVALQVAACRALGVGTVASLLIEVCSGRPAR